MEKIKSGKQILDDFFKELPTLSNVDKDIADLFITLYKQNKFTDINIKNQLFKLRDRKNDENKN